MFFYAIEKALWLEYHEAYSISFSEWTEAGSFTWLESNLNTLPAKQINWDVAVPTQEQFAAGSKLLLFTRSNVDGTIQTMPSTYLNNFNDTEVNRYEAIVSGGLLSILHTKAVDGIYEMPAAPNEISFRYIIVTPDMVPSNGRTATVDFENLSYEEIITLLGIPR